MFVEEVKERFCKNMGVEAFLINGRGDIVVLKESEMVELVQGSRTV